MAEEEIQIETITRPHGYYYQKYILSRLDDPEFKEKRMTIIRNRLKQRYHEDEEYRISQINYMRKYRQENKEKLREYHRNYMLKRKELIEVSLSA